MTFKVSKIQGNPRFDSLPVAVIKCYPLEKRDYKPYAQCIFCIGEESLILRLWAFEVSPLPDSRLRVVLYLFADKPDLAVCADLYSSGEVRVSLLNKGTGTGTALEHGEPHPWNGEDLQGVYWGGTFEIPLTQLSKTGKLLIESGDSFGGNFYKLCETQPFVHYGCWSPADFSENAFSRENMGEFQVVSY